VAEGATVDMQPADGLRDRASFGPRIGSHQDADWRSLARAARRHELRLGREVGVATDEICRAVEDALIRPAVVGQRQAQSWKPSADVVDLSVSPSVDRLLRVTHDCYVAEVFAGREPDEVAQDPGRWIHSDRAGCSSAGREARRLAGETFPG